MTRNRLTALLVGSAVLLVVYLTFFADSAPSPSETVDPVVYRQQMQKSRINKDAFFRTDAQSPIRDQKSFGGLAYFPPDPAYRLTARLEPFADKTQKLVVRLSDNSEEVYDKVAHVVFRLKGETCRLLVVKLDKTYSILFRDATSGKETYGGGRYLELDPQQLTATTALLDFNQAYNPYCAYNPGYACPLPPVENRLNVAVRAGEKYVPHE